MNYTITAYPYLGYLLFAAVVAMLLGIVVYLWHIWNSSPSVPHVRPAHGKHPFQHDVSDVDIAADHMVAKARDVLEQSIDRARHMLEQTDTFQRDLEREAKDMYLKSAHQHEASFDKMLEGMRQQYKQVFDQVATAAVSEVGKMLSDQRLSVQDYLKKRIDAELDQAKQEIQLYKESQMQQAGSRVDEVISSIAKNIVSVSLSKAQQKELIYRALEKAKSEGVFGDMPEAAPAQSESVQKKAPPEPAKEVAAPAAPAKTPASSGALQA